MSTHRTLSDVVSPIAKGLARLGRKSVYAKRTVGTILGTEVAAWRAYPSNRENAEAFLAWAREYGNTGALTFDVLVRNYVAWCHTEEVQPIAENVLLQEMKALGVRSYMLNLTGTDGYRYRPMAYVLRPIETAAPATVATVRRRKAA